MNEIDELAEAKDEDCVEVSRVGVERVEEDGLPSKSTEPLESIVCESVYTSVHLCSPAYDKCKLEDERGDCRGEGQLKERREEKGLGKEKQREKSVSAESVSIHVHQKG